MSGKVARVTIGGRVFLDVGTLISIEDIVELDVKDESCYIRDRDGTARAFQLREPAFQHLADTPEPTPIVLYPPVAPPPYETSGKEFGPWPHKVYCKTSTGTSGESPLS